MSADRLAQLLEFLAEDPNDPFNHYALAMEHLKLGDVPAAEERFRHLVAQHPGYVGTYYHFGKLLESKGLTNDAVDTYRAGIKVALNARNFHAKNELDRALNALLNVELE